MSFDMNQCKKGDKLVCRDGDVAEYVGKRLPLVYTHEVMMKDVLGHWGMSTTSTGERFEGQTSKEDITGFYKEGKQQMIERNKEYDLKVTGEQLAWLYLILGHTNGSWSSKSELFLIVENMLFHNTKSRGDTLSLNIVGIDLWKSRYIIDQWLDNIFKTPETEKEKNLRELKEKHEQLGKAIQKLEQSN